MKKLKFLEAKLLLSLVKTNTDVDQISLALSIGHSSGYKWMNNLGRINYDETRVGVCSRLFSPKRKEFAASIIELFGVIAGDCSLIQKGMKKS